MEDPIDFTYLPDPLVRRTRGPCAPPRRPTRHVQRRFRCPNRRGILPLWPDGSLTLVGQYRYAIREYSWEIPEGGGSLGDDPESIARRELLEETGIQAQSWEYLGRIHTSNCFVDEVCHLFLAKHLTPGPPLPDAVEVLRSRREPFAAVLEMALDGRITDSITIGGVLRLLARFDFRSENARY